MAEVRPRRVLVVEDDDDTRDLLTTVTGVLGFEAREAANGKEALETAIAWRPDLIVLDLVMPEMNGWEFRAEQRRRDDLRDVPVIVLSGRPDPGPDEAALEAVEVLPKPFEIDAFLRAVSRHGGASPVAPPD